MVKSTYKQVTKLLEAKHIPLVREDERDFAVTITEQGETLKERGVAISAQLLVCVEIDP